MLVSAIASANTRRPGPAKVAQSHEPAARIADPALVRVVDVAELTLSAPDGTDGSTTTENVL